MTAPLGATTPNHRAVLAHGLADVMGDISAAPGLTPDVAGPAQTKVADLFPSVFALGNTGPADDAARAMRNVHQTLGEAVTSGGRGMVQSGTIIQGLADALIAVTRIF